MVKQLKGSLRGVYLKIVLIFLNLVLVLTASLIIYIGDYLINKVQYFPFREVIFIMG